MKNRNAILLKEKRNFDQFNKKSVAEAETFFKNEVVMAEVRKNAVESKLPAIKRAIKEITSKFDIVDYEVNLHSFAQNWKTHSIKFEVNYKSLPPNSMKYRLNKSSRDIDLSIFYRSSIDVGNIECCIHYDYYKEIMSFIGDHAVFLNNLKEAERILTKEQFNEIRLEITDFVYGEYYEDVKIKFNKNTPDFIRKIGSF
jgi:hypothetical protein